MSLLLALLLAADPTVAPTPPTTADELQELRDRIDQLERKLGEASALAKSVEVRLTARERFKVDLGGYLDLGFFWVQGNGSGVRRDLDHTAARYNDILSSWVLIGDPLSTTINSRGDAADLSDSRAVRFDALHSQGRPTFLINAVNLSLRASLDDTWFVTILVDLLPRERIFGGGGSVGDFIDIKMASLRWEGRYDWGSITVNAGKFDSLLGLEYRTQEAPQRLTITPSLVCRYTCGRPMGLKVRAELLDSHLELGAAITNGSSEIESFPFSNETDFNIFKTVSGRVAVRLPVADGLELTTSGAIGAQDRQRNDGVLQWHLGAAARLEWGRVQVQAEYVIGRAGDQDPYLTKCAVAPCIKYKGAYGLVGVRVAWYFVPYLRVDWRQADLRSGTDYAYMSDVMRATVGVRYEPNSRVAVKAEYTFNRELTAFQFPNDVLTTSFVVSY
ncbi:MAG: hypothetical protein QM817_28470 [Archangium sp.]